MTLVVSGLFYSLLCYAMRHSAIQFYAMLRYTMLCYAVPHYAMRHYAMLCNALSCYSVGSHYESNDDDGDYISYCNDNNENDDDINGGVDDLYY